MRHANLASSPMNPHWHVGDDALRTGTERQADAASLEDPFVTTRTEHLTPLTALHVTPTLSQSQKRRYDVCRKLDFEHATPISRVSSRQSPTVMVADNNKVSMNMDSEDEAELVPLSPNVCIERRASRRKARGSALVTSPKRDGSPMSWVDSKYMGGEREERSLSID